MGAAGVIALLALLFSQVMSNVGATVMMVPMAINIALASNGNPAVYALIVAISTSNTFLLPSASPVLLVVAGPGGYRGKDFPARGAALTLVMLLVMLLAVNLTLPPRLSRDAAALSPGAPWPASTRTGTRASPLRQGPPRQAPLATSNTAPWAAQTMVPS